MVDVERLFQRYAESVGDVLSSDPKYILLSQKSVELYSRIAGLIGEENEHLLREYEDTESVLAAMLEEQAYKSGFADGARLLRNAASRC